MVYCFLSYFTGDHGYNLSFWTFSLLNNESIYLIDMFILHHCHIRSLVELCPPFIHLVCSLVSSSLSLALPKWPTSGRTRLEGLWLHPVIWVQHFNSHQRWASTWQGTRKHYQDWQRYLAILPLYLIDLKDEIVCVASSFEIRSKIHCGSRQIFLQFLRVFLVQLERFSSKNNFLDISRLILREQSGKHERQQGAWSAAGCGRFHSTCWGTGLPHLWYDYLVTLRLLTLSQYCTLTQTKHSVVRSSS